VRCEEVTSAQQQPTISEERLATGTFGLILLCGGCIRNRTRLNKDSLFLLAGGLEIYYEIMLTLTFEQSLRCSTIDIKSAMPMPVLIASVLLEEKPLAVAAS